MATRGWRSGWMTLFVLALLLQFVGLYLPSLPTLPGGFRVDKVLHAAVFLAPALFGVLAGIRPIWLAVALVGHAVVSEVVQHYVLTERAGDPWDVVADAVGVGLGLVLGWAMVRRRPGRGARKRR